MKRFYLSLLGILLIGLVSASYVSVFQGQYHEDGEFQVGEFNFEFKVYDNKTAGNLIYNVSRKIEIGLWGQWVAELEGISAAANNASKDYFMEITINGEVQAPRKIITHFAYLRKDIDEVTSGSIVAREYKTKEEVETSSLDNVINLNPRIEPLDPELGMIYLDIIFKKLRFYNGSSWINLSFETEEKIEEEEEKVCESSKECDDWGDCINDYQTRICIKTKKDCETLEEIEEKDCGEEQEVDEESTSEEEVEEEVEESSEADLDEAESEEEETEEEPPEELFDITFNLEESFLKDSRDLITWVTLESFGTKSTPTRLIYIIRDSKGNEVEKKIDELKVVTEETVVREFEDLDLSNGEYNIELILEYGGVKDSFERRFSVRKSFFDSVKEWLGGLFE